MKHPFHLRWMLVLPALAVLSCSPKVESDDPFAGAKWIGTSERMLYADFLPQFILSADVDVAPGSARASISFSTSLSPFASLHQRLYSFM